MSWAVLNVFLLIATVSAEFYTSLTLLKTLVGTDKDIALMINGYVEKELERLDYLKKFLQELQGHNDIRRDEEVLRYPFNVFLTIKEIITNWNKVVKIMRSNSADYVIRNMTRQKSTIKRINYPREEDLSGAAIGLLRLQDAYYMDAKDIADGKILNSQMRTVALTAGDCFEIGSVAYNEYDYYHAIMWMQEARERVEKETIPTANLQDIIDYLAFSLYKQGNLKQALLLTDELYRMNPNHLRAKDNIKEYEDMLEDDGVQSIDMRRDIPPINNVRHENDLDEGAKLTYEALCRQEVPVDTKTQSRSYCYYKIDRPYLHLAPFKVEIVRQSPLVVLFYNIVSDEEARIIQMLAVSKARLALLVSCFLLCKFHAYFKSILSYVNFDDFNNDFILSAYLKSTEHEIVKRVDKRLELATNLGIETAEDLRVHNYGIGGYFGPHFDCELRSMTEPEIGGRTVFMTNLRISVPCIKNALLFWYNLMRNGEVDMRSQHAACPVLTGIKWIMTKQFRERGQEWRRPCGLNQFDQERYVGDLGAKASLKY
ncbi:unnamed protein product [Onchocerca ochengi]|uniref:procollagen-proline 4-dioxygenase n=1 Tax=Onchocerca ochengi TaxID=42157 RepID=A0A182ECY6_ONCOC|nr:unnamed protein product [Onchocerca ochengi]